MSGAATNNDGGVVLSLFLMAGTIAAAMHICVGIYVHATQESGETSVAARLRLGSACSNIGNSIVHLLLILYMLANKENTSDYWEEERKLGGIEGPLGLAIINFAAGMCSLHNSHLSVALGWNSFVIVLGTLIPVVWFRFVETGLSTWPYTAVLVWFLIFFLELSAFSTSITLHFIRTKEKQIENKKK